MSRIRRVLVMAVTAALAVSTLATTASAGTDRAAEARAGVTADHTQATKAEVKAGAEVAARAEARPAAETPETEEVETRTFQVTITNLTEGQMTTPFVVATHDDSVSLFARDTAASNGLQQLAENGAVPVLVEELAANPGVLDVQVAASADGPVAPGASVTVEITADVEARWISLAGMLICTNDGFGGVSGIKVPNESRTVFGYAYDAGTEINTEAYADLVPPCDGLGLSEMTNPELAEGATVHAHRGITGIADLDPAVHGWTGAVIQVDIELIG